MKISLGFCLVGLCMGSAWGQGAPLLLDWGTLDTGAAVQQKDSEAIRKGMRAATVQQLNAQGAAPWLVQFDDVIQEEWKTALKAAGAKLKGYIPENGLLLQATPKQIAAIAALDHVAYVGEFLPTFKRAAKVRAKLARVKAAEEADAVSAYRILLFSGGDLGAMVQKIEALTSTAVAVAKGEQIRTDLTAAQIEEITGWGEVQWVEPYAPPRLWNNVATQASMMNVSNVWTDAALGLTGRGQIVAVADTGLDSGNPTTLHPDFTNRVTGFGWSNGAYSASYSWADLDEHGTHVCGSVLGNGTKSSGLYKGPAYEANLIMQGMQTNLSGLDDVAAVFKQAFANGARIHSDSWGYGDAGLYNADSRVVDQFVWSNKTMLIVIAAGNDGEDLVTPYGVIDPGSVASPSTAKNCLTVGASENYRTTGGYAADTWGTGSWTSYYPRVPISNDYISRPFSNSIQGLAGFSGRGPCNDGRIKPDIVAPGTDIISTRTRAVAATGWGTVSGNTNYIYMGGTSMATPLTAGAAVLARQWLVEKASVTNPSAALMKALLMNGARDMAPGQYGTGSYKEIAARPDNAQGFGHVDLYNTLQPAANQFLDLYDTNSLSTGQTNTFTLTVSATSTNKFILTMAYADYWGTAGSGKQLVNDLDLTVQKPSGTTLYANGRTSKDATNNVELIEFAADESGTYTVRVSARTVSYGSPQAYALVVRGPKADETPTAPVFGANPGPLTATVGELMDFTVTITAGYPTPVLALQSTTATVGTYDIEAGYCVYQPPAADVGTNTFTFTATNASGTVTQTVTVVVNAGPPSAPASIWASVTNSTDFTAAWSSVSDATSYRLDVGTNATFSGGGASSQSVLASNGATVASIVSDGWSAYDISGTTYAQLLKSTSVVTSPAFSTVGFTNLNMDMKARTYGGASGTSSNITVSISTNNGSSWTVMGVVAPWVNSMNPLPTLTNTANLGHAQTRIRWQTLGATGSVGVGITNLVVQGWSAGGTPAYVPGYSNRTVAGTSQSVTGLLASSTYYFRARAVNDSGTSPNSPTATVTTVLAGTPPTMDAIPAQTIYVGADLEYTVTAQEPDTDSVTFACTSAVDVGRWDIDANTGDFLFSPTNAQIGTNFFSFTATDKDGTSAPTQMVVKVYSVAASNVFTQWVEDQQENPASSNFWENADYDGDGQTTYQEYMADTDPASSNSVLKMEGLSNDLKWFSFPASPARYYQLEYCTDITNQATVAVSNLGWGKQGMVVTNKSTGTWYGVIRARLTEP